MLICTAAIGISFTLVGQLSTPISDAIHESYMADQIVVPMAIRTAHERADKPAMTPWVRAMMVCSYQFSKTAGCRLLRWQVVALSCLL